MNKTPCSLLALVAIFLFTVTSSHVIHAGDTLEEFEIYPASRPSDKLPIGKFVINREKNTSRYEWFNSLGRVTSIASDCGDRWWVAEFASREPFIVLRYSEYHSLEELEMPTENAIGRLGPDAGTCNFRDYSPFYQLSRLMNTTSRSPYDLLKEIPPSGWQTQDEKRKFVALNKNEFWKWEGILGEDKTFSSMQLNLSYGSGSTGDRPFSKVLRFVPIAPQETLEEFEHKSRGTEFKNAAKIELVPKKASQRLRTD